jgi:hypothetical protein
MCPLGLRSAGSDHSATQPVAYNCTDTNIKSPVFLLRCTVLRSTHLRGHDLLDCCRTPLSTPLQRMNRTVPRQLRKATMSRRYATNCVPREEDSSEVLKNCSAHPVYGTINYGSASLAKKNVAMEPAEAARLLGYLAADTNSASERVRRREPDSPHGLLRCPP